MWYHSRGTYTQLTTTENFRFYDTFRRPRRLFDRSIYALGEVKDYELERASGGISESGKRHGRWSVKRNKEWYQERWHRVPLASVTVEHLARLRTAQGHLFTGAYLFSHLADPDPSGLLAKDLTERVPYKSLTLPIFQRALAAIGLEPTAFRNPIHSLRKSFVTRFNAHGIANGLGPVGEWMSHGKSASVAGQSYDDKWPSLCTAVATIGWPAAFLEL